MRRRWQRLNAVSRLKPKPEQWAALKSVEWAKTAIDLQQPVQVLAQGLVKLKALQWLVLP